MSSDGAEIKVTFPRAQGQKGLVPARHTGFPFSVCSNLGYSLLRPESIVLVLCAPSLSTVQAQTRSLGSDF